MSRSLATKPPLFLDECRDCFQSACITINSITLNSFSDSFVVSWFIELVFLLLLLRHPASSTGMSKSNREVWMRGATGMGKSTAHEARLCVRKRLEREQLPLTRQGSV